MITLTRATELDVEDLLRWRNDPTARAASGSNQPVSLAEHAAWLSGVLSDDHRFLYIAHHAEDTGGSAKVGMCRFDLDADGHAEVSINLNPDYRGKGFAREVLGEGIAAFRGEIKRDVRLTATIRPSNAASVQIFRSAGFVLSSSDDQFSYYVL